MDLVHDRLVGDRGRENSSAPRRAQPDDLAACQPYLRDCADEARQTARLLTAACGFPVTAVGVVVPVGKDDVVIKSPPTEVHVVYRRALARWLRDRPSVLTDDAIAQIFTAARRSTTWQPSGR